MNSPCSVYIHYMGIYIVIYIYTSIIYTICGIVFIVTEVLKSLVLRISSSSKIFSILTYIYNINYEKEPHAYIITYY